MTALDLFPALWLVHNEPFGFGLWWWSVITEMGLVRKIPALFKTNFVLKVHMRKPIHQLLIVFPWWSSFGKVVHWTTASSMNFDSFLIHPKSSMATGSNWMIIVSDMPGRDGVMSTLSPTFVFSSETWNTGSNLHLAERSSLYATWTNAS